MGLSEAFFSQRQCDVNVLVLVHVSRQSPSEGGRKAGPVLIASQFHVNVLVLVNVNVPERALTLA